MKFGLQIKNIFKMKLKIIKNKKAAIEEFVKIILWIVVFIGLALGIYFLVKFLTEGI